MYYKLRDDVRLHLSSNEYYLSFINNNEKCLFQINGSGFEILSLCSGTYTENEIICLLQKKYPEDETKKMVKEFLDLFILNNLIYHCDERNTELSVHTLGSADYFCPSIITLELTNNCPLNCRHCYLGEKKNVYLSKSELSSVLKEITELGVIYVQLTGGEVATYPYLEYAIDYLTNQFVQVNISTSGIDCSDKTVETVKKLVKLAVLQE